MKKSLAAAAVLLVGASLSACGGGGGDAGAASSSPKASATSSPAQSKAAQPSRQAAEPGSSLTSHQDIYLAELRKDFPNLNTAPDAGLIGIGEGVCRLYNSGASSAEVNDYLLTAAGVSYTVTEFVAMHGAAVGAFCPEHIAQLSSAEF